MKTIHALLAKLHLRYRNSSQEKDYFLLKLPLVKEFFIYLFIALGSQWAPLIIRYFQKNLVPQNYIAISLTVLGVILFFFRKKLGKALEYVALGYLITQLIFSAINTHLIINKVGRIEAYYIGYTSALLPRLLGYRIVQFQNFMIVQIVGMALRFSLVAPLNDPVLMFITCAMEFFTILLNYRSEVAERKFFDTLYRSKQQLLKFKHLLTENLPNQVAIFSKDFEKHLFQNKAFMKAFESKDLDQIKDSFNALIVEKESVEKNRTLLARLGLETEDSTNMLSLSKLMEHISKNIDLLKKLDAITLQVIEKEEEEQKDMGTPEAERERRLKENTSNRKPLMQYSGLIKVPDNNPSKVLHTLQGRSNSSESVDTRLIIDEKMVTQTDKATFVNHTGSAGALPNFKTEGNVEANNLEVSAEEPKKRIFTVKIFLLQWDEDEAICLLLDNITHERTLMELKIADKNKDLVITMISHELRTPLNGILGLVDIAKKMLRDMEVLPYLNACKNSGILLLNFVNSILDLSQVRNNKMKLVYSRVSIPELFNDIRPLFDYFCLVKKLYLKVDIAEDVPLSIVTDKNRLSQILINLIGNAFKFTFNGGITISVERENEGSSNLKFSVRDTGIGIKNQDQEKLFKLFGRLDHQNNRINTSGAGIGLTISNTLATLLDTQNSRGIQVESKPEKGSVFSFVVENRAPQLVYEKGPEDVSADTSMVETENGKSGLAKKITEYTSTSNHSILCIPPGMDSIKLEESDKFGYRKISTMEQKWCLIVDDTPLNLVVAEHIMSEKGYQTKTAMNGKQAIEVAVEQNKSTEPFKLILMDCQMPVMDGYEATRRLKDKMKKGELKECPIVALTAHQDDKAHAKLCQDVGMDGTLGKPLQVQRLMEIIKRIQRHKTL